MPVASPLVFVALFGQDISDRRGEACRARRLYRIAEVLSRIKCRNRGKLVGPRCGSSVILSRIQRRKRENWCGPRVFLGGVHRGL